MISNSHRVEVRAVVRAVVLTSILFLIGPSGASQVQPPQTSLERPTGLLFDDVYLRHLVGNTGHPERPERLTAIRDGLEKAGLLKTLYRIAPRRVTNEELALVHKPSYVALVGGNCRICKDCGNSARATRWFLRVPSKPPSSLPAES